MNTPFLLDEGLFGSSVSRALRAVNIEALAVGEPGAPTKASSDETNCQWCAANGAILVTNDRGKKDKKIFDSLATHHVHALFVHDDLRKVPPHHLLRALLKAEHLIDKETSKKAGLLRHRLQPGGGIQKR